MMTRAEPVARDPELVQAEADLERSRARVAESVNALRDEVARRSDWRDWIRQRPGLFLASAFALGFFLGRGRDPDVSHKPTNWRT
jgi:hypothetical protein